MITYILALLSVSAIYLLSYRRLHLEFMELHEQQAETFTHLWNEKQALKAALKENDRLRLAIKDLSTVKTKRGTK